MPYVSYFYSGQNLQTVSDGRSSPAIDVSYDYDPQWRLKTETEGAGAITYSYVNAASDDLASYRVDPRPGQTATTVTASMSYDLLGRLSRIDWSPVSGGFVFAYNDDGQYTSITFPNGQSRTFAYDNQGRLTSLANLDTHAHNLATYNYAYDYDWATQAYTSLGNRTSVAVSGLVPTGTNKYVYDASQQLTGVTRLDGTNVVYTYDAIGNRTGLTVNGSLQQYTYYQNAAQKNTPRMQNPGFLTYDANGNVTTGGYSWDAANRLSAISPTQFQYDAQDRRAVSYSPSPGPGTVNYVSLGLNTIAERSSNTARANDYLFGPGIDEPLARRAFDGTIQYYAVDGLGSVTALTSPSGQINRTITYDEWGIITSGTVDLFGYTGREIAMLAGTPLWYYRARHYAPNWGRFVGEDPWRYYTGQNTYPYVRNDPVDMVDPTGMVEGPPSKPLPDNVCKFPPNTDPPPPFPYWDEPPPPLDFTPGLPGFVGKSPGILAGGPKPIVGFAAWATAVVGLAWIDYQIWKCVKIDFNDKCWFVPNFVPPAPNPPDAYNPPVPPGSPAPPNKCNPCLKKQ